MALRAVIFSLQRQNLYYTSQAEHTEHQIKQHLRSFISFSEEATITALREEEEQKVQISQLDPQTPSGALIHVPRYLGNLLFRVWKKMQDIVQNSVVIRESRKFREINKKSDAARVERRRICPMAVIDDQTHHYTEEDISTDTYLVKSPPPVILDPNTAHPSLILSDDLTKGFNSGTHCWDVEVKESLCWHLGVTTASNQRKGDDLFDTGLWSVQHGLADYFGFSVKQNLQRVRVDLNYDKGTVSFSDPVTNTHLHTFTTTFTDTVLPFFYSFSPLKILPLNSV
ncbi:E3 ubiquitin-protein ligase TRIM39 [Labeo rohita]|uniref:E3 ubiquitin-protein ligase TRIM39 n=1 Tax=Labeo rohita TaxID=84645 RepID=A0ABQ8L9G1_LABRO|nr:E3 ubiquitin-protein ligase TRIM39 [Labeo rohita]